jgi:hypothetical protein
MKIVVNIKAYVKAQVNQIFAVDFWWEALIDDTGNSRIQLTIAEPATSRDIF